LLIQYVFTDSGKENLGIAFDRRAKCVVR